MSCARGALSWSRSLISEQARPHAAKAALLTATALVLLTYTTGYAAWYGLLTGVIVVLVWVCLAWVAAFTGDHFDTYERGAHAVVEQLSPLRPARAHGPHNGSRLRRFARTPEVAIIAAALALVLAHMMPHSALLLAIAAIIGAFTIVWRRRAGRQPAAQPDYAAAVTGVATFGAIIAGLRLASENGSIGAFVLVVFVVLASVRIGRAVGARIAARSTQPDARFAWLRDSVLLATPLLLLVPFAAIDMGLVLVLVIPLASATLLATGARAAGARLILPALVLVLALGAGRKVVFPATDEIRAADDHAAQAQAFGDMSKLVGLRLPILATPMDRAAARSVATRDPELAERLLIAAGPGPARDLLIPSIEQVWGTRAYARAGWWGDGLGQAVVGGRGVAEVVSYAENTFSVFVLGEHGAVGGMLVLVLYMLLASAVGVLVLARPGDTQSYRASRALFLVAALIIVFPAAYVALSNVGAVPITGQNMPFLGLNAWSDVAISAGVIGILITGALRGLEEVRR
jgi:cell division protein FtsW (lipid II flippase)